MATVGQPDALRRITVHYGTDEADFDGLDDGLLGIVIGDVLQDQVYIMLDRTMTTIFINSCLAYGSSVQFLSDKLKLFLGEPVSINFRCKNQWPI